MDYKIIFILLLGQVAHGQIPYFNIQFDYQNRWEAAMRSSIETDSAYYFPVKAGTPWFGLPDTSFILKIDKLTASLSFKKIGLFNSGQSVTNTIKVKNKDEIILQGSRYNSEHESNVIDNDIYLSRLSLPELEFLDTTITGFSNRLDVLYRPIQTSDGGIFSSGWSFTPTGIQSILLFKCDSNLNQQFLKLYPANPTGHHFGAGLVETPDKGIIVVGNRHVNIYNDNAIAFKVDTLGNVVWRKDIAFNGDTTNVYFGDITRKDDGTYLLVGNRRLDPQVGPAHETFWLVNMDGNGHILWSKEYDPNFYSFWQTITLSLDGNFYACGVATVYNPNPPASFTQNAVISKLSPEGGLLWHRKYTMSPAGKYYDIFFNVLATSDGGILCNGSTYENDTTRQNAWVVKLDGNGCLGPGPGCSTDSEEPIELPVGKNSWVNISPNPTSGLVSVTANGEHRIEALRIFDPAGRLVQERQGLREKILETDLGSGPAGVYVVSVLVDGVWNVRQVVKTR